MELTPEERRRIYEEEKERVQSESLWHMALTPMKEHWLIVLVIGLTLIGYGIFSIYTINDDGSTPPIASPSPTLADSATQPTHKSSSPITNPPSSKPTPYDPVKDDSEEGIRQNILAATDEPKITYEQLKKNAERYDGEPWAFNGRVFQIQESGGHTGALISLDAWGNKMMRVEADFTTDFVEKDQVYVVGYLGGNYSYTSVANWNITIPLIKARAILKPSEAARIKAGKIGKDIRK